MKIQMGVGGIALLSLTSALDGGGWSSSSSCRFTYEKETRYAFYRRLGGFQGRSGRVRRISSPTGIRSPDRLASGASLHRLHYPDPIDIHKNEQYLFLHCIYCPCLPFCILYVIHFFLFLFLSFSLPYLNMVMIISWKASCVRLVFLKLQAV